MDRKELEHYFWLKHEIKRQKKRLKRLQQKTIGSEVGDTVLDYNTGKGIPSRVEGIPREDFDIPVKIIVLEEAIAVNIAESEKRVVEIEKFIQSITDPKLREIIRSRYIDCKSWEEVGETNYIAADYARQLVRDFFKTK